MDAEKPTYGHPSIEAWMDILAEKIEHYREEDIFYDLPSNGYYSQGENVFLKDLG